MQCEHAAVPQLTNRGTTPRYAPGSSQRVCHGGANASGNCAQVVLQRPIGGGGETSWRARATANRGRRRGAVS